MTHGLTRPIPDFSRPVVVRHRQRETGRRPFAKLEVLDSDTATGGIQIAPGFRMPTILMNSVDNDAGQIGFSCGAQLGGTPPTGSFLVGTITFRAKAPTGDIPAPLTFAMTSPRHSLGVYAGDPVPGVHHDSAVHIAEGATINGLIALQGGSRPASSRAIPVTVMLFNAGAHPGVSVMSANATLTFNTTTEDIGSDTVACRIDNVPAGTYDIMVSGTCTLHNVKRSVVVSLPAVTIDFGTLLEADCNNDGMITIQDFSMLASAYGRASGQAGFNSGADFDGNGTVNIQDFSIFANNYMKTSPAEVL